MENKDKNKKDNTAANAAQDLNSAKNLAKAAGKAAAQNYVGAAKDVAKEVVTNPKIFLKIAVVAAMPLLIIIILIISPFAIFFSTISDDSDKTVAQVESKYENPDEPFDFEKTVKDQIYKAVLKAYKDAENEIKKEIKKEAEIIGKEYDEFSYSIVELVNIEDISDEEIAKLYSCFSVLKEREHLNTKYDNENGEYKTGEKEKEIFNKNELIKIVKNNYYSFLTYTVDDYSYTETLYDKETLEPNGTKKHGVYTYTINFKGLEDIAVNVFGLQDNTNNMEVEEKLRYNEIEIAEEKQISLLALIGVDVSQRAYVSANSSTYKAKIDELKNLNRVILNINFTPNKKMQYPLKDYPINITSKFGNRIDPHDSTKTQFHHGIDFGAISGTYIYPIADGIIIEKGYNDTYGNFVVIYHGEIESKDYVTVYMHMLSPSPYAYNTEVTKDSSIGRVGNTGLSTGPHLHFAVLVSQDNGALAYVNPESYFINR